MFPSVSSKSFLCGFSAAVMKCIEDTWKKNELVDITVEVEDAKFECHSFLLSVCSGFFRSIFKDNVTPEQRFVRIEDITAKTFSQVLTVLYSGTNIINKKSLIDIWNASHKLQIPFLITSCEEFAILYTNLESYQEIYMCAKKFKCLAVLTFIIDFIAKNFNSCKDSELILHLSGDELLNIVKHQELVVKTEDFVIDVILKWIDYPFCESERTKKVISKITADDELKTSKLQGLDINSQNGPSKLLTCVNSNYETITSEYDKKSEETLIYTKSEETFIDTKSDKIEVDISICHATNKFKELRDSIISHNAATYCTIERKLDKTAWLSSGEFSSEDKTGRLIYLIPLLEACKTCLLSPYCLGLTYNSRYFVNNIQARDIIFSATLYQSDVNNNDSYLPPAAIHRKSSNFENVGLCMDKDGVMNILSFSSKKWQKHSFPISNVSNFFVQITVHKNELYALSLTSNATLQLQIFKGLKWFTIYEMPYKFVIEDGLEDETSASFWKEPNVFEIKVPPSIETTNSNNENSFVHKESVTLGFPVSTSTVQITTTNTASSTCWGNATSAKKKVITNIFTISTGKTPDTSPEKNDPLSTKSVFPDAPITKPRLSKDYNLSEQQALNVIPFSLSSSLANQTKVLPVIQQSKQSCITQWLDPANSNINLISHGSYIYFCSSSQIQRVDHKFPDSSFALINKIPKGQQIEYLSSLDELLLIFCSEIKNSDSTILYLFDTNSEIIHESNILDGPARGMITFQDDKHKYMLQSNGTLWTMTRIRNYVINFENLANLWRFDYRLNGGIYYNGELYLHGDDPSVFKNSKPSYPEIFKKIHVFGLSEKSSKFVPFIISKKHFQQFNPKPKTKKNFKSQKKL